MLDNNFFSEYGYLYLEDLLTKEVRLRFASIMLLMKEKNFLVFEGTDSMGNKNNYYNNSYGGNHQEFEDALISIQPIVEKELGFKLKSKNSYARIYYDGGELNKHVDRSGLDYTLSICLFNNLNNDWPLWCIDAKNNEIPINIGLGDGVLMLGTKLLHWREPLICKKNQFVIQLFMHWVVDN
jgi:hypothetical protein